MEKDRYGSNVLHCALDNDVSIDIGVISKLVEVGGRDIVMEKDGIDRNSLNYTFRYKRERSIDI